MSTDHTIPAALTMLRAGPMATVQDLGRLAHRSRGVPVGGAFDLASHELANALVGNEPDAATVELTLFGGLVRAELPMAVALAGAPMPARRRRPDGSDRRFMPPVAFNLLAGDLLEFGGAASGVRTYLAVRGGWMTPIVLGSRSTEESIGAGDTLPALPGAAPERWLAGSIDAAIDPESPIRLIDGPDAALLRNRDWHRHRFVVGEASDRMGLRLEGSATIEVSAAADRTSAPIAPGAVQVSGGRPIVLGVACGTMGGYPHVAHVVSADLGRLAQARPGQAIRFRSITLAEARHLDRIDRLRRRALTLRVVTLVSDGQARPIESGAARTVD